jgi:single-stranded-DNA-specific exonuclease
MKRLFTPEWVFPKPVEIPEELRREIGGSELFLQMLVRRGITDPQSARPFLDPDLYQPCPASVMPGIDRAIPRLLEALKAHEKVGIWGDFDVDGQTSTAVLVSALRTLGCDVVYHVPVRGPESHGISIPYLEKFILSGPTLILTCDTGISANDAVDYANNKGVDVIITDHHTLPEELPQALALVNPHFLPSDHPLATLSGVGVAYKLVEDLFSALGRTGEEESLLDLVALGLIADVATLTGDARYLVQRGIQQIRSTPRLALETIFKENNIRAADFNESGVSFTIAPRLNAVGRLSDANPMVEFLLTSDPVFAATTCNQIEGLNSERKIKFDQVFRSAQAMIEAEPKLLDKPLLYLGHPDWAGGVVGLVANRLVELYHRPAILFNTSDCETARGSARSVDGIDITAAISRHKEMLTSFGGHPMAAGLAVPQQNFDKLKYDLFQTITKIAEESGVSPTIEIDMQVDLNDLGLDTIAEFEKLAPFGPGNPPILYAARNLAIESALPMGRSKEHEAITLSDETGNFYRVVWWQAAGLPHPGGRFDLAFSACLSDYKGSREPRLEWQDYRECEEDPTATSLNKKTSQIQINDLRSSPDPVQQLKQLAIRPDLCVYAEGTPQFPVPAHPRSGVTPSKTLAIWTIPPSLSVLRATIQSAQPEEIIWFASHPEENDLAQFLKRIGSLLKSQPPQNEVVSSSVETLAEKCATTVDLIQAAVNWYTARGDITLLNMDDRTVTYTLTQHPSDSMEVKRLQNQITVLHNEVIAFRDYYAKIEELSLLLPEESKNTKKPRK